MKLASLKRKARTGGWSRWVQSERDERAMLNGCTFDVAAAERVREFFGRFLVHTTGKWAGKPFELLDWQWEHCIGPLYGWKQADGRRRYRTAYWSVAKKNGKTGLCSGLALYQTTADGEQGAEVYSAAADRDQASIIYREAAKMVKASPMLSRRLEIVETSRRIVFREANSFYWALSAVANTKEGYNVSTLLVDELHAQKTRELWDALRYATAARDQPLTIIITTAGYDKASICYEQYSYAKQVLAGVIEDDSFLPYICEAEEDDDWTDPATWKKANPSFGVTIDPATFESECKEAQAEPRKENSFRRYRLNQWVQQAVRWIPSVAWEQCGAEYELEDLAGRECYAGLDLASKRDVTACVLVFPPCEGDKKWRLWPLCWVPHDTAWDRENENRGASYVTWAREGFLRITEGNACDYDVIRRDLNALVADGVIVIKDIGYDPWNAQDLAVKLEHDGFTVASFQQSMRNFNEPSKEFERLIITHEMAHPRNKVLTWMAHNVAVSTDANDNIRPDKKKSPEKIDGIVAAIMGLARAMLGLQEPEEEESVYETRGVKTF